MKRVTGAQRRAERLLRWYPRRWRERYADEFVALLLADLGERPRCWRRSADVARGGLVARLSAAGLASGGGARPQAALATICAATVGFVALAMSLWAQLVSGSLVSTPDSQAATLGLVVLTATGVYLGVLAVLAIGPVALATLRAVRHRQAHVARPAAVMLGGAAVLAIGGHYFAARWPAATHHTASGHGLLTAHAGSYGWAETLGISTFWVHPHTLLALPAAKLAWMCLSPVAAVAAVVGAVTLLQRIRLSSRVLRFEAGLAKAAAVGMAPALAAATAWVTASQGDANSAFRAGTLDLALIAGMAIALLVAAAAADQLRHTAKRALR